MALKVIKEKAHLAALNYRKLFMITLRIGELAFGAFFFSRLKAAGDPVSKNHGATLRLALIAINNKLYNYEFGRETNYIKYVFAMVFIPSFMTHLFQIGSLYSVTQLASIIFEILCMVDVLNTTQSETTFNILTFIKVYRMIDLLWSIIQAARIPLIRDTQSTKKTQKQEKSVHKENQSKKTKSTINDTASVSMLKKQSEMEHDLSKLNGSISQNDKQKDSTNDSVGSSLPTNEKIHQETEEKHPQQKAVVNPPKDSAPRQRQKPNAYPVIRFNLRTDLGVQKLELNDPYKFDEVMSTITGLSELELLHTKLNYCSQLHSILKNQKKKETKLHDCLASMMTSYASAIMLIQE